MNLYETPSLAGPADSQAYGDAIGTRVAAAVQAMQLDGWWDGPAQSNKAIRKGIFSEMLRQPR